MASTHSNKKEVASGKEQPTPRQLLGITDREFEAMGRLGAMYYNQGDLERARIVFAGMIEADPGCSAAHAALGALLVRTDRFDTALEHLNRAIELNDQELTAYVNRAEAYLRRKEVERAVADLKHAIALDPTEEDPAANRARAMMLGLHQALKSKGLGN